MKNKVKPSIDNQSNVETICAVVVTYNRKKLLLECLSALKKQTRPLDAIYIIDNASTDGTQNILLENGYINKIPQSNLREPWEITFHIVSKIKNEKDKESFITIHYVKMNTNSGGAGGFYEGVRRAYEKKYDWLWLMDDDVVTKNNSLKVLICSLSILKNENIGFLSSRVISSKNDSMNIPSIDNRPSFIGYPDWEKYLSKGIISIKSATFVSCLVPRRVIKEIGLPCKEFFIWGDDVEYTLRITSHHFKSFLIGRSEVIHKRAKIGPPNIYVEENFSRIRLFYYMYRNSAYIKKKYYSKKSYLLYLIKNMFFGFKILSSNSKKRKEKFIIIIKGLLSSLFFNS